MGYFVQVSDVENILADEIRFALSKDSVTEEDETKIAALIDYQENRIISHLSSVYDVSELKTSSDGNLYYITMEFLRHFLYMRKRKGQAFQDRDEEYQKACELLDNIYKGNPILEDVTFNTKYKVAYKSCFDDTYFRGNELFANENGW